MHKEGCRPNIEYDISKYCNKPDDTVPLPHRHDWKEILTSLGVVCWRYQFIISVFTRTPELSYSVCKLLLVIYIQRMCTKILLWKVCFMGVLREQMLFLYPTPLLCAGFYGFVHRFGFVFGVDLFLSVPPPVDNFYEPIDSYLDIAPKYI